MTSQNFSQTDLKKAILFEDPHLLVIDKPAGLLSQGGESDDPNLVDLLREYLGRPYVGLVHRLDRNTSGLMVVAKRTKAAERLTNALQKGTLRRRYVALVHGALKGEDVWSHWLRKNEEQNKTQVFDVERSESKRAQLRLHAWGQVEWKGAPLTLVTLQLETGRSHQIRAQASFEGHPLLGDLKYAAPDLAFPRTALHSYSIEFPHPKEGEGRKSFQSALPADFLKVPGVAKIRFE